MSEVENIKSKAEQASLKVDIKTTKNENTTKKRKSKKELFFWFLNSLYKIIIWPFIGFAKILDATRKFISGHVVLSIILVLTFYFMSSIFNPFNLDEVRDDNAANFLNLISSPFYGQLNRQGQQEISVVLITEQNMETRYGGGYWPPSYKAQIEIVRNIAKHQPKAIFLDLYYSRPQVKTEDVGKLDIGGIDNIKNIMATLSEEVGTAPELKNEHVIEFAKKLKEIRYNPEREIPIFIGPVGQAISDNENLSLNSDMKPLQDYAKGKPGSQNMSVGLGISEETVINYPYISNLDGNEFSSKKQAAHALLEAFCFEQKNRIFREHCDKFDKYGIATEDIAIKWGFGSADRLFDIPEYVNDIPLSQDERNRWIKISNGCRARSYGNRLLVAAKLTLESIFGNGTSAVKAQQDPTYTRTACSYHDSISSDYLFSGMPEAQLQHFLKDKVVLVGADISYLSDNFETPVYGKIPGVFIHAMALDNLLEYGPNHNRAPNKVLYAMDFSDLFAGIMLCLMAVFLYSLHTQDMKNPLEKEDNFTERWAKYLAATLFVSVISMAIAAKIFKWPIGNIIEIGLTSLSMIVILEVFANKKYNVKHERL